MLVNGMFRVTYTLLIQVYLCDGAQDTLLPFHFKGKHKMVLEVVMLLLMLHLHH